MADKTTDKKRVKFTLKCNECGSEIVKIRRRELFFKVQYWFICDECGNQEEF